jgi:predicted nucleic acid-binding protein
MPFVLDTSVALAWCFADETTPFTDHVLDMLATDQALTPAIWPLELANALLMAERRHRLQQIEVVRFAELVQMLPIVVDQLDLSRALSAVLPLARAQQLTSYDAAYLELAMREEAPLATQDARLSAAAIRVGVTLIQ